ncbi:hypothetical protein BCR37DRAFT_383531 [Protomyces lactucae-debilis]|uniref:LIM zinc-binding domain-containing protein n=1 Tax=Protomyces lactucae-debilis TaxID=2754530 RepID=A0A1Y2EXT8_PROLT|nr:uncharacterized protein BCR37DRAFT_383531 [Protomyces lactucae-debilis]ORY76390.1 hypothetical protein BCR37DRAFT_383531 [Protomyces lactucae-debilis]
MDASRISQVLPTLKCSKCGAAMRLDAVGDHICETLPTSRMPAIIEMSPAQQSRPPGRPDTASSRHYHEGHAWPSQLQERSREQLPKHVEADAVLGRLNTLSRPLNQQRFAGPPKAARAGPVQMRDPRMTVMPLRAHPHYEHREDDVRSVASRGSNRSQGSQRSGGSAGRLRISEPLDDALASMDSGPFGIAGVASRLDPTVFVAPEFVNQTKKPSQRGHQDEWRDQGARNPPARRYMSASSQDYAYEQRLPSRPSTAGSQHSGHGLQLDRTQMHFQYDQEERPRTATRQVPPRQPQQRDPYARYGPDSVPAPSRLQLAPLASVRPPASQEQRHIRQDTSSSLGTVMTSRSGVSVRSSISSATPETVIAVLPPTVAEEQYVAPSLLKDKAARTQKHIQAAALPRSGTTESFDRLLADIGASIDELQPPREMKDPQDVGGSPSSHYSPVPAAVDAVRSTPRVVWSAQAPASMQDGHDRREETMPVPRMLGSPASLRSKETMKSQTSSEESFQQQTAPKPTTQPTPKATATSVACRACKQPIKQGQKSVSSKDGKLTGKYHKDCFRCTTCFCLFPAGDFYVFDDRPYCGQHYHAANGSLCDVCGTGVEGACVADGTKRWHATCFERKQQKAHGRQGTQQTSTSKTALPAGVAVLAGGRHGSYDHF